MSIRSDCSRRRVGTTGSKSEAAATRNSSSEAVGSKFILESQDFEFISTIESKFTENPKLRHKYSFKLNYFINSEITSCKGFRALQRTETPKYFFWQVYGARSQERCDQFLRRPAPRSPWDVSSKQGLRSCAKVSVVSLACQSLLFRPMPWLEHCKDAKDRADTFDLRE